MRPAPHGPIRPAAGLYCGSTIEQDHSGLGLEAQQASVRAFAKAQGWTLAAEYSDIASGKDDHRPGFQAALVRCRQLGAVLAAARLDRVARRAHTLSQLLEDGYSVRAADMPGADDLIMLDEIAPVVHVAVEADIGLTVDLGRDHRGAAIIKLGSGPVGVECFVVDQSAKDDTLDQWLDADAVVALAAQQDESHQIAEGIDKGHDLGGQAAA
jgi:hypothetical protein